MDPSPDAPPSHPDDVPDVRPSGLLSGGRLLAATVVVLMLLAGGAALVLRAGGSSTEAEPGSGTGPVTPTHEDAALEYAQCMRDQGLEHFPDPVIEPDGGMTFENFDEQREAPGFPAAEEACRPILDEAGPPPPPEGQQQQLTPEELADREDKWLGVARCVRDQGYDYPDPQLDEFGNTSGIQTDDAGFAEAINGCVADADLDADDGGDP
jgi:hypothetical protein